jgi:hypothetical protein
VSARVIRSVRAPGSKEISVPAGAIAHGRILQVKRELRSAQFLVSIRFDTLETKDSVSRLSIRLAREIKTERRELSGLNRKGRRIFTATASLGRLRRPSHVSNQKRGTCGFGRLRIQMDNNRAIRILALGIAAAMFLSAKPASDPTDLLEQARDRAIGRLPAVG